MTHSITWADVEKCIQRACGEFEQCDGDLLDNQVNERSMTHRLACYLQHAFPDWHVDCEYNRREGDPKRLRYLFPHGIPADDTDARTVYPDIIVHHRGKPDNLLVIEAKKDQDSDATDEAKLLDFLRDGQYAYRFAAQLNFDTENKTVRFRQQCVASDSDPVIEGES